MSALKDLDAITKKKADTTIVLHYFKHCLHHRYNPFNLYFTPAMVDKMENKEFPLSLDTRRSHQTQDILKHPTAISHLIRVDCFPQQNDLE